MPTIRKPIAVMVLLLGISGCSRGKVLHAAPIASDAVRVVPVGARLRGDKITLAVNLQNRGEAPLVLDRNQFAIVVPGKGEYFRSGPRHAFAIPSQGRLEVAIAAEIPGENTTKFRGIYLRLDGLYMDGQRVVVEPLRFGDPQGDAGAVRTDFEPPDQSFVKTADDRGLAARLATGRLLRREAPPPAKEANDRDAPDSRQFSGRRARIGANLKVATLPLVVSEGVAPEARAIGEELLLTELQRAGFTAIGTEDVNAMVGFEQARDAVGCETASCMAEIGNALGVSLLATGRVSTLGDTTLLLLKLLNVQEGRVVARDQRIVEGGLGHLPRVMAEGVQAIVKQSKL